MIWRWLVILLLAGCAHHAAARDARGRPLPPRILDPRPGAVIVDVRPSLVITPPAAGTTARVDFCADATCSKVLFASESTTEHVVPDRDLRTGVYYLRSSAHTQTSFGLEGPVQKVAVELRTVIDTPRFIVEGPKEARRALAQIPALAEQLVDFDCKYLAIPRPDRKLRISFYGTSEGYALATDKVTAGRLTGNSGAFTRAGYIYLPWYGRFELDPSQEFGTLERVLAHELVHAAEQEALPFFGRQPPWLPEATAELLAVLSLSNVYGVSIERAAIVRPAAQASRQALANGYLIPVDQIIEADPALFLTEIHETQHLFYSEAYALLRSLDDVPEALRAWLRETVHLESDVAVTSTRTLHSRFGSGKRLDERLRGWLERTPRTLEASNLDARLGAADTVRYIVVHGSGRALDAFAPPAALVELDAAVDDSNPFVQISFGFKDGSHVYGARFWSKGRVQLVRADGEGTSSTVLDHDEPRAAFPSRRCRFGVRYDDRQALLLVNDVEVGRAQLPIPPVGRAGVFVTRGELVVHGWRVTAQPPIPVAAPIEVTPVVKPVPAAAP